MHISDNLLFSPLWAHLFSGIIRINRFPQWVCIVEYCSGVGGEGVGSRLGIETVMTTDSHSATLALLPKFTGALSAIGSTYIFQDVIFHKNPIHRVYHRLCLGLSCADMVASVVFVLSTWPTPETRGVYLSSGTTQTCTAQGFFNELGNMATPLYNTSLCAYYVLVIRNAWFEDRIRSKAEPWMHAIPIVISLTISLLGLPFDLYNNAGFLCWIAAYPQGCQADGTCTRGVHADIFRWVHYAIIWSAIFLITLGMYSLYLKVKEQERIQSRETMVAEVAGRGRKSRQVAIQAFLFVGALYLTWIFTTVRRFHAHEIELCAFFYKSSALNPLCAISPLVDFSDL
jgi:hypothetical protein